MKMYQLTYRTACVATKRASLVVVIKVIILDIWSVFLVDYCPQHGHRLVLLSSLAVERYSPWQIQAEFESSVSH